MNNLVFDRVDSQEKLEDWKSFASGFDHATDTPITPLVNVSRREEDGSLKRFGFYSIFAQPLIFPSFHPKHTTPRDFHDMICAFSNAQCLSSISPQYPAGVSHVGLVTNGLPVGRSNILKTGYDDLGISLFRHLP